MAACIEKCHCMVTCTFIQQTTWSAFDYLHLFPSSSPIFPLDALNSAATLHHKSEGLSHIFRADEALQPILSTDAGNLTQLYRWYAVKSDSIINIHVSVSLTFEWHRDWHLILFLWWGHFSGRSLSLTKQWYVIHYILGQLQSEPWCPCQVSSSIYR